MSDLLDFVSKSYAKDSSNDVSGSNYMPVAALLTGINKPDYHQYFKTLSDRLMDQEKSRATILPARDCPNVKAAIENLVSCTINCGKKNNYREDAFAPNNSNCRESDSSSESVNESDAEEPPIKLRRNQYTLSVLHSWYSAKYPAGSTVKPKICVIIPNFEEMKPSVMKDLILILR